MKIMILKIGLGVLALAAVVVPVSLYVAKPELFKGKSTETATTQ